ncbi:hypothetical protein, partial [Bacillus marinisedimentorum]|uniref:hypothetical protein n=1 Tax=Bacillus marinisedimentorum TaxID=1821260 RepID=UPI001B803726
HLKKRLADWRAFKRKQWCNCTLSVFLKLAFAVDHFLAVNNLCLLYGEKPAASLYPSLYL